MRILAAGMPSAFRAFNELPNFFLERDHFLPWPFRVSLRPCLHSSCFAHTLRMAFSEKSQRGSTDTTLWKKNAASISWGSSGTTHWTQHSWHSSHSTVGTPQLAQHSWHSTVAPVTQLALLRSTVGTAQLTQHSWHSTVGTAQLPQ